MADTEPPRDDQDTKSDEHREEQAPPPEHSDHDAAAEPETDGHAEQEPAQPSERVDEADEKPEQEQTELDAPAEAGAPVPEAAGDDAREEQPQSPQPEHIAPPTISLPEEQSDHDAQHERPPTESSDHAVPPSPSARLRTDSQSTAATNATARTTTRSSLVFVITALETIAASKDARRTKKLADTTQKALSAIKGDGDPSTIDPEILFEPLQLATEANTVQVVTTALDCIGKLISYSYFSYPSEQPAGSPEQPALIDRAIDTICDCFQMDATHADIELQILKSLLSAILNDKIVVHGAGLLKAVRQTYNIFLHSKSSNNQQVAQGALTQMVGTVFERVKSRLRVKEARINLSKTSLHKNSSGDVSAEGGDIGGVDANGDGEQEAESPESASELPVEKDGSAKITLQSFENRKSFDDARIADNAPTLVTRNKTRRAPSRANTLQSNDGQESTDPTEEEEEDEIYVKDAYLVFRAMCRLSIKSVPLEEAQNVRSQSMRSKLLSLHIIHTILHNNVAVFVSPYATIRSNSAAEPTTFVQAIKQANLSASPALDSPNGPGTPVPEDDPNQLERAKQRKTALNHAVRQFNYKPKKGIKVLLKEGFIPSNSPEDIARFCLTNEQIDKKALGEYLGEGDEENVKIMHSFVDLMDFTRTRFVDSLRRFLQSFRLPGEGQKIDRFMLKFAERYMAGNPSAFANADTAYVLAYSVIMLNTDLHSAKIRSARMTPEDFIKNNRGINDNADLPDDYLKGIYEEIASNEIVLDTERENAANLGQLPQPNQGGLGSIGQAFANVGRDLQREAYIQASEQMANKTEQLYKSLMRAQRRGPTRFPVSKFIPASSFKHVGPMFAVTWMPFLTALSGPAQDTHNLEIIKLCMEGQKLAIRIACLFDLEDPRQAFVASLSRFTNLYNLNEMKAKNIEALYALLDVAQHEGNLLKESWRDILTCISQLDRFQLISAGIEDTAVPDLMRSNSQSSLQKLVEISSYNMNRVRFEWTNIWQILGEHFNQVGCHTNTNVVFFALNSLRQLSMKFMEIGELPGFKFQKDFLKPFEHIMKNTSVVTVKDMVLRCLIQMIQARGENIRSGWRTMFGVFTVAAKEPYEGIVNLAFDNITQVYSTRFGVVISQGAFADLVVCLTEFSKNHKFQRKSLQAIETLKSTVPKMLRTPECPLSIDSGKPKDEPQAADVPKQPTRQTQEEQFWFPVLFAYHDVLMTGEDLEVRSRALTYLFETLTQYGSAFPRDFWDTLWRQILYPIFMVLRSKSEMSNALNHEELTVWLSTTFIQALRHMINLFTHFFESLEYMLDRFLELLALCICQENDTLARIGSNCLQQLVHQNVTKFTPEHWEKIVSAFVDLFNRTEATALFSAATSGSYTPAANGAKTPKAQSDTQSLSDLPLDSGDDRSEIDDPNALGINGLMSPRRGSAAVSDDEGHTNGSARMELEDYKPTEGLQQAPVVVTAARRRFFNQIITKCVLQLLMIETVNELFSNDDVYAQIPSPQLLRLMMLLKKSYQFAKRFNEDRELRTKLFREGFMKQPPNLLKQESGSAAVYVSILFRMYHDTSSERRLNRANTEQALIPLCVDIVTSYIQLDEETQQRNIVTWRPVVIDVLDGYAGFPEQDFEKHVKVFAPLVVGLLNREMGLELQRSVQGLLQRVLEVKVVGLVLEHESVARFD
ncbi:putative guanyl-nucleotide exchange factor protein [Neofusicoccum parvum UCRNP2]|uniref:Putative guanyl-nucleotide exchange factor protein n=1 Tax=Botryosphaeria parva (strain UCR-NP2) TaxID=1287680 RepID=R1EHK1_BOTPV|nr:putative guanyl-nucleotide exchange factor protein [Neofusicoccum parvum UCRNP2]